jgi:hypothetical protein
MAIGNPNLFAGPMSEKAKETVPGMAYFANTGPFGKTCGDCINRGYRRLRSPKFDAKLNEWVEKSYNYNGCAKFKELTGNNGPVIDSLLHSCKYFEDKASEQSAHQQGPSQARDRPSSPSDRNKRFRV